MANLRTNNLYGISGPDANGSALFDGSNHLTAANAAAFRVNQGSTEDFTIEAWIYLTATPVGANARIASIYHTSGNQRSYMFYIHTDDQLKFNYASSGTAGSVSTLAGGTVPHNEWVHVAVAHEVSSTTLRLFKNGIEVATDNSPHSTYYANTSGDFTTGEDFTGNISNLHITRGTCKYTGNFTPYKQPIEEDSNTTVLCLNSFIDVLNDDKSNTFTQTASGGVKASTLFPFNRNDEGLNFDGPISLNTQGYMYFPTGDTSQRGGTRGIFGGSYNASGITGPIDYITIQSQGNSIDFGDLSVARQLAGNASSKTRGLFGGGNTPSLSDVIDFVTFSTTSNATDFGNLTVARVNVTGTSSDSRGLFAGGSTPSDSDVIDYVTIASAGNATDFGNLQTAKYGLAGCGSQTRGIFAGGYDAPLNLDVIDYVTIATTGNAADFGNLTAGRRNVRGCSSHTRGLFAGGNTGSKVNTIDYITIATTGNATDFGDTTSITEAGGACSSLLRGVFAGGSTPSYLNTIAFVTIANTGDASDFGDLTSGRQSNNGTSNGHGGLE